MKKGGYLWREIDERKVKPLLHIAICNVVCVLRLWSKGEHARRKAIIERNELRNNKLADFAIVEDVDGFKRRFRGRATCNYCYTI